MSIDLCEKEKFILYFDIKELSDQANLNEKYFLKHF
jgi:hypothetical protein